MKLPDDEDIHALNRSYAALEALASRAIIRRTFAWIHETLEQRRKLHLSR
jgi:hypothetical protein